jgi:glycoprotein endo-alpha-1,2-mannosidase
MEYMCENYFDHPSYYKIDGRPVIFVYVTRKLEEQGVLEATILTMRTSASKCGHDIYLIGDHIFESAPDVAEVFVPFWFFDALTNYDVYGSMGRPSPFAGRNVVDTYYAQQEQWRNRAHESGCRYIPAVSPGYNDRGVRPEKNHPPLSRKLTANSADGSLFAYQLSKATRLVDPQVDNLLVVNSFNEWHEDTQIEPVVGERTNLPLNRTDGVYYEGYGELYLDLLREATLAR